MATYTAAPHRVTVQISTTSVDANPDFRRLRHCRYANDFPISVIGSEAEARQWPLSRSSWRTG
jgi:hypothetical protein